MKLMTLSQITVMRGVKILASDLLIPREFCDKLLAGCPDTLKKTEAFFTDHPRAQCVVIRGFNAK